MRVLDRAIEKVVEHLRARLDAVQSSRRRSSPTTPALDWAGMDRIELVPMTAKQYEALMPEVIAGYAHENVVSGRWTEEESMHQSREQTERLLPQGLATPDHRLWTIARAGDHEPVGMLWIHVKQKPKPHAFIYYIEIYPQFRRHGYAEQAMTQFEEEARRLGLESIRLDVFDHNAAARPLYAKLGYEATNILMAKRLK